MMKKFIAVALILIQFVAMGNGNIRIKAMEPQEVIFENYTYRIVNEEKKEIELLAVDTEEERFEMPETINGYTVVSLGYKESSAEEVVRYTKKDRIKGSISANVKELVIPCTVKRIGRGAFANFDILEKVIFPQTPLSVSEWAFCGCDKLNNIDIPVNTWTSWGTFDDCESLTNITLRGMGGNESFLDDLQVVYVQGDEKEKWVDLSRVFGHITIKKVIVKPKTKEVNFAFYAKDHYASVNIENLIVNDKKTKLRYITDKKKWATATKIQTLYTIRGAKCIAVAEREGMNHHVKSVGKMGKVTKKKVKNGYRYSWKEVNTSVEKNVYKEKYAKWKSSNYKTKTVYRIYGKEKKADEYRLLGKTAKTTYKTMCKYVKVKPVKVWS